MLWDCRLVESEVQETHMTTRHWWLPSIKSVEMQSQTLTLATFITAHYDYHSCMSVSNFGLSKKSDEAWYLHESCKIISSDLDRNLHASLAGFLPWILQDPNSKIMQDPGSKATQDPTWELCKIPTIFLGKSCLTFLLGRISYAPCLHLWVALWPLRPIKLPQSIVEDS